MAKHANEEYEMEVRVKNEPGVLGVTLLFRGSAKSLATTFFKHPGTQNATIYFDAVGWHEHVPQFDRRYDQLPVECPWSATGYCHGVYEEVRWHQITNLPDGWDLLMEISRILSRCDLAISNTEAVTILGHCESFLLVSAKLSEEETA